MTEMNVVSEHELDIGKGRAAMLWDIFCVPSTAAQKGIQSSLLP